MPTDAQHAISAPPQRPIGHTIQYHPTLPSTNSWLLAHPQHLTNHGLVVIAAHQSAGRGRQGKSWASVAGKQLQCSIVIHPPADQEHTLYALLSAVAVAEAIQSCAELAVQLKWPNDVLIAGKKVAGILVEMGHAGSPQRSLVVGIGINCLGSADMFPQALRTVLTTLSEHSIDPITPAILLRALLEALQRWHRALQTGKRAALLETWHKYGLLGRQIRVRSDSQTGWGYPLGLDQSGFLRISDHTGQIDIALSAELEWDLSQIRAAP